MQFLSLTDKWRFILLATVGWSHVSVQPAVVRQSTAQVERQDVFNEVAKVRYVTLSFHCEITVEDTFIMCPVESASAILEP